MGWYGREYKITILTDDHGGKAEDIADILAEEFLAELQLLITKPKYNQAKYIQIY